MSSDFLDRIAKLSPQRLALLALELHEKLEAAQAREPIAIVGIGCRLPGGADDPQAFWELLRQGRDAVRDVPPERWDIDARFDPDPDAPGRMSVRNGAFLDRIDGFDASFFGIAPREAQTMDPQQRLALEVAWEALEHAGIAPASLAGSNTGVFVGVCNSDHFQRVLERGDAAIDAYLASGNAHSVVSGRIAYFLNLRGPALSIDTACSSSLVALHMAIQSLRSGEVRAALAGGVNVMCSPQTTIALTKAHMLAPDGRCKTFDAAADGFARGEGCGMLVLKRLDDAQADGDRVLALIRGSASNQDGKSGGLTVPSGPAQEAVIRAALADAGLQGADIDYVEAHGTGTTLGDPIEVRALGAALCEGRSADAPLRIGSVKTNIGHLESAAGVAGVIKVVLALLNERVPPHLHFKTPSPHIDWQRHPVQVCADGFAWPRGGRPRRAGVSSFGFSGTNVHVILEQAPAPAAHDARAPAPLHVLPLSARSSHALAELARRYLLRLDDAASASDLADIAACAGSGRSHMTKRAAVVAADVASARAALQALVRGEAHEALHVGSALPGQATEFAFLFTGQGAQYPGMAQRLYALAPDFAAVIDRCDQRLGADAQGRTLKSVLAQPADDDKTALHDTAWTQPALFAVELALTELWKRWGVAPAAAIGHSIGEYAAACAAGVFSLDDGLALVAERGRLMQALPPGGSMAALYAPADEVRQAIAKGGAQVCIAAFNAPDSVVIAGATAAVDAVLARMNERGVQGHKLHVALAAHSPAVEPALAGLEAAAARVPMHAPAIPLAWNVTGAALPGGAPDPAYWRRHLREPVRFADGVRWLAGQGFRHFIEVGPHPTLAALAERNVPEITCIASMRRGKDDWDVLMHALAAAYVAGAAIDWAAVQRPFGARRVALPTYPFERQSYWVETAASRAAAVPDLLAPSTELRGRRLSHALPSYELLLRPDAPWWLGQHRLHGAALVAGPVFVEIAAKAAADAWGGAPAVSAFEVHAPLVVPADGVHVQVHFVPLDGDVGTQRFEIHSRAAEAIDATWLRHASGRIALTHVAPAAQPPLQLAQLAKDLGAPASCAPHYARLRELGIDLQPAFASLQAAHRGDGEVLARLQLADAALADDVAIAHPGLLDGALQACGLALPPQPADGSVYLLAGVQSLRFGRVPLPPSLWCHARLRDGAADPQPTQWLADVTLHDERGAWLGALGGVTLKRAARESLQRIAATAQAPAPDTVAALGHALVWEAAPPPIRAAAHLVAPALHADAVAARFEALATEHGLAVYDTLLPRLDAMSASYVALALQQLGFADVPGRRLAVDSEARALGVVAPQRRLFARLLQMLAEDGVLAAQDDGYVVRTALDDVTAVRLAARHAALVKQHAPVDGELSMLHRCGEALARVLRGEQDPLQLLFPGGSFAEAHKLYVESPYARTYNGALAAAIGAATARLPAHARLRVLEIGGGTGGTTGTVLPLLDAARTEYTFTDLSPLFLERAAERFGAYPFVKHQLLDIERDPSTQGFANGRYDVVIAANVLHACADLGQALAHARALLADGGQLLLLEGLTRSRWVDLTFGLTEGWWRFTDSALRTDYPLLARAAWPALLERHGFGAIAMHPPAGSGARAQQALIAARAMAPARRWHLAGGPAAIVQALQQRLQARGDAVTAGAADELPPLSVDTCVYLGAVEAAPLDDAAALAHCESRSVQQPLAQLAHAARGAGRVWLVTQGVQRLPSDAASPHVRWAAPLWGLARVFALEHPQRFGGVIDLPPAALPDSAADALLRSFDADDDEDQVAWRDGVRHAARLIEQALPAAAVPALRSDATYLVTGGFGGLGLQVATWLAERGVRHLALLGRRPQADAPALQALRARGVQVLAIAADVADAAQVNALPQQLRDAQAPALAGIFHLAANLGAAPIAELEAQQVRAMLRPKLAGTVALQALARTQNVELLVLFSTTTALLGAAGLAHYAGANAFLDASAEHATGGTHTLSINWGTWEAMRLASASDQQQFRAAGLLPMRNADALAALERLLAAGATRGVVAAVDWPQLKSLHEARRARPLLRRVGEAKPVAPQAASAAAAPANDAAKALLNRLRAAPHALRRDVLVDFVQAQVSAVLALPAPGAVALHTGLFDLGMDSLMAVELKRRLERGVGRVLPSTLTFNYPNVGALALFLDNQLADTLVQAPATPHSTAAAPARDAAGASASASELDALSDEELETRLLAALEKAR
jgi:acyl transferase domain-containing protein/SAM-dependent methyltransferase/NADP-dependent 3-hydroxy acid dehydrogenase YdfG